MDSERWRRIREAYEGACELSEEERAAYLDRVCGADAELRREVESMLAVPFATDEFLEPPDRVRAGAETPPALAIEGFEIVRPIAAGGMGTVYEARQQSPRRTVALKVLQLTFGEGAVRRRFEIEAEILAQMRHPGVAQVHAAGVHRPAGEGGPEIPWFAMELVEGALDLVSFARGRELDLPQRLALFLEVCDAVEYGHRLGIVHRDLKPANVLVDARGRPKVIDFGVARATGADFATSTFATRSGELLGTLHYMAPEQLDGDPSAVDTRCDVHALGLLLYELACERRPWDLAGKPLAVVARTIREEPPPNPRRVRPELPEDLSWILLRALEKEPDRRYPSVSELAADVRRLLDDEPVLAGPPSTAYRVRKFVRRHRLWVSAGGLVAAALLAGTVAATVGLFRAERALARESDEADKFRRMNEVLVDTLTAVQSEREGRDVRVVELLDPAAERIALELAARPRIQAALQHTLARSYLALGLAQEAVREGQSAWETLRERVPAGDPERLAVQAVLADALVEAAELDVAEALLAQLPEGGSLSPAALEPWLRARLCAATIPYFRGEYAQAERELYGYERAVERLAGSDPRLLRPGKGMRAKALRRLGRYPEALELTGELLVEYEREAGPESSATASWRIELGTLLLELDRNDEALEHLEAGLAVLAEVHGPEHPNTLHAMNEVALVYQRLGRLRESYAMLRTLVEVSREVRGPDHRETLTSEKNLAVVVSKLGDPEGSLEVLRAVLATERRVLGEEDVRTLATTRKLALQLALLGELDEARELAERVYAVHLRERGSDNKWTLEALATLANVEFGAANYGEAEELFRAAWLGLSRLYGATHDKTLEVGHNLGATYFFQRRWDEAIAVLSESLRAHREVSEPEDPDLLMALTSLGSAYFYKGELDEAERRFAEALDHAERHFSAHEPEVVGLRGDAAKLYLAQGRAEDAAALMEETVRLAEESAAMPWRYLARARLLLSESLAALELHDEAAEILEEAWQGYRTHLGEAAAETRALAGKIAASPGLRNRPEEAERWRRRAAAPADE